MTTQIDRELLELAAKAIGNESHWNLAPAHQLFKDGKYVCFWNPLTDDGDALRLAVKLRMNVDVNICFTEVCWVDLVKSETHCVNEDWGAGEEDDAVKMRYVRRAIVRAAAEIGRAMQ